MWNKLFSFPFIAHRNYDLFYFLLAPILATVLGSSIYFHYASVNNKEALDIIQYIAVSITNFHLVLVFYRSHGNREIFKLYPYRFTLIPLVVFGAMFINHTVFLFTLWLAIVWDAYHSSMQVFGIGRIYDFKNGANPHEGRGLDIILNILIHFGPIVLGVQSDAVIKQLLATGSPDDYVTSGLTSSLSSVLFVMKPIMEVVLVAYLVYYIYRYRQLMRAGYKVSYYKWFLYALVFGCNLYVWHFHTVTSAWISLNVFHAIQYFGIVWWNEGGRISNLYGMSRRIAFWVFLISAMMYGLYVSDAPNQVVIKLALTVALIHYWYDGFIWSTRKKQV